MNLRYQDIFVTEEIKKRKEEKKIHWTETNKVNRVSNQSHNLRSIICRERPFQEIAVERTTISVSNFLSFFSLNYMWQNEIRFHSVEPESESV